MRKNNPDNVSIPPSLTLASLLSCSFTIVVGIIYITLCSLAIHVRTNCDAGISTQSDPGSTFFSNTLLRLYFKQEDCSHSLNLSLDVTQEHTIFLLVCITLAVSLACLILAVTFIAVLKSENAVKYVEPIGYCYVVMIIISLAIDLVTAFHFGMDYSTFTQEVDGSSPGVSANYVRDMYRLGAFFLVAVSLKGFMMHIFNVVFVCIIIVYLVELKQKLQNGEHAIHRMGALRAFETKKNEDTAWLNTSGSPFTLYRGSQASPTFMNEEYPRVLNSEPSRSEFTSASFNRSDSWHHNQPSLASRPFSYLEDNKRQAPLKAPSSTKEPGDSQWQREPRDPWEAQAPPVPAPDYSPETPRRLKSALKSSYM